MSPSYAGQSATHFASELVPHQTCNISQKLRKIGLCGGRRPSAGPINGGGGDVWGRKENTVKLPKSQINSFPLSPDL